VTRDERMHKVFTILLQFSCLLASRKRNKKPTPEEIEFLQGIRDAQYLVTRQNYAKLMELKERYL